MGRFAYGGHLPDRPREPGIPLDLSGDFNAPPERERLRDRLLLLFVCGHCLTPRLHPTHLLVCDERRARSIHRRRNR